MAEWKGSSVVIALVIVAGAVFLVWDVSREQREMERRFDEVDRRIDAAMPRDSGIQPVPEEPDLTARVVVGFDRRAASSDGVESVLIRISEKSWSVPLPPDGVKDATDDAWFEEHWEPVFSEVVEVLRRNAEASGARVLSLRVPSPSSPDALPPALVIRMLSAGLDAGITDVEFGRGLTPGDDSLPETR